MRPRDDDINVHRLLARIQQAYPDATIIASFIVLHDGWDLDNRAAVIKQPDGTILVIGTDHGNTLWTYSADDLEEQLQLYKMAAKQTRNAISLLKQNSR